MTAKRKALQLVVCASLVVLANGCSGLRASHSVAPSDFLIPGGGGMLRRLLYAPPPVPPDTTVAVAPVTDSPTQIASVR